MRTLCCLAVIALWTMGATLLAGQDKVRTITFAKDSAGKLPTGWKAEHTGKGGGVWKIVADDTAPSKKGFVLAQTGKSGAAAFNLCVAEETNYKDVEVSVMFKANDGITDQGGGIVWRCIDANNYYVARFNPLEDNFRLYKVVDGKRMELDRKEEIKIKSGEWHKITIKMVGNKIECYLDGKKLLEATDDTFQKAGKVGLWTKADAQTSFDMVAIVEAKK